jgi:hypothetical protein
VDDLRHSARRWRCKIERKRVSDRPETWHVHCADVRVGLIEERSDIPKPSDPWEWRCGLYPGSAPGDSRSGTAATFDEARFAFEATWREYLPKRCEADFEKWRYDATWRKVKYERWDAKKARCAISIP